MTFVYHSYSWPLYSYLYGTIICIFAFICRDLSLYYTNEWLLLTPGSSLLHFSDGYNVFHPSCYRYDLTHQGESIIVDFTTLGISHIYDLPCHFTDSLDPLFSNYTLMSQENPQKTHVYVYTRLLKQYPRVHATFEPIPTYIRKCA